MKEYYLQITDDGTITDAVEYACEGYVKFETESALPVGVIGGWWKLINGALVENVEKNPMTINNKIKSAIDAYTMELIEGGIL